MTSSSDRRTASDPALFDYLLALGDTALINGQRLSEWCGHGPFLEEDLALANKALDLVGRARMLLSLAGEVEGRGRGEDELAYLRDERDWRNLLVVELPRGDFAFTTVRQFFVDAFNHDLYEALQASRHEALAAIAAKAFKESVYHLRHSSEWMLRLGGGTAESHRRAQAALEELWPFTAEMFLWADVDRDMHERGIGADLDALQESWQRRVRAVLAEATLEIPDAQRTAKGGRQGLHTEHMGFLLAEMQFLQRAYPGLQW